jgi:hypothetical protein
MFISWKQRGPFMNTAFPYSRREKLMVVLLALATGALLALAISWYHSSTHRWSRIVSPTGETAVKIVAVNRVMMPYVETDQGNLLFCSGSSWRDACTPVERSQLPINNIHPKWMTCPPPFPETPPLPGVVVDMVEAGICAEARTYSKVVLLSDGSLWHWRHTYSWVEGFTILTAGVLGLLIGWGLGVFVINLRRYLRAPLPGKI